MKDSRSSTWDWQCDISSVGCQEEYTHASLSMVHLCWEIVSEYWYTAIFAKTLWLPVSMFLPSEYYCRSIFIPLVGHLISEQDDRFSIHHQKALQGMQCWRVQHQTSTNCCILWRGSSIPHDSEWVTLFACIWNGKYRKLSWAILLTYSCSLSCSMFPNNRVLLTILCILCLCLAVLLNVLLVDWNE